MALRSSGWEPGMEFHKQEIIWGGERGHREVEDYLGRSKHGRHRVVFNDKEFIRIYA